MNTTTTPVPPATFSEMALALVTSDNILRDIRLSMDEGILAERAAYHRSHIDRATAQNHLIMCNRCRQREKSKAANAAPAPEFQSAWPLHINPKMDSAAADLGLSHWSCWSPYDNRLWVRRDGRIHEHFLNSSSTLDAELRAVDAHHRMKAPALITRARAGGIRVETRAGMKAHAKAKAEMAARMAEESAPPETAQDPYIHSRAGTYEFTGSEDTMAGLTAICVAMGAIPPQDAAISEIHMERAAVLHAHHTGCRLRQRLIAAGIFDFAFESQNLADISIRVHRLDRAIALLNTALGWTR